MNSVCVPRSHGVFVRDQTTEGELNAGLTTLDGGRVKFQAFRRRKDCYEWLQPSKNESVKIASVSGARDWKASARLDYCSGYAEIPKLTYDS